MKLDLSKLKELSPETRKEAEKLLEQLQTAHANNPLYQYQPLPHQDRFHRAQTKIKMLKAGNRAGKTCAGIVDDLIQCVDSDILPEHLKPYKKWEPPFYGRVCAPKFNENHEGVIFPTIRQWVPREQLKGGGWDKAFSKQRRMLFFENGSWLQFLTYEQDLDAFAGAALHRVHFDEEPPGDKPDGKGYQIFRENMMRLADHKGDFLMTLTPLFGVSWSHDEIFEQANDEPQRISIINADSLDNKHVNREELLAEFQAMSKEERDARQRGEYIHFAGKFYGEFSDDTHVVPAPKPEHVKGQNIVVGIDPGLNRTGIIWLAFDNDNMALAFAEFYPEQMVVSDVCREILRINALWGIEPDYYVIDPSARNRATVDAEKLKNAYLRGGISAVNGQNDRAAGILEVKRRLQQKGLVVSEALTNLRREFIRYRKDPNSKDEFAAIKKDDHLLDALRYVCLSRVWTAPGEFRAEGPSVWEPGTAPPAEYLGNGESPYSYPLGAV